MGMENLVTIRYLFMKPCEPLADPRLQYSGLWLLFIWRARKTLPTAHETLRLPLQPALFKHYVSGLVVRRMTISEYPLLIDSVVFSFTVDRTAITLRSSIAQSGMSLVTGITSCRLPLVRNTWLWSIQVLKLVESDKEGTAEATPFLDQISTPLTQ